MNIFPLRPWRETENLKRQLYQPGFNSFNSCWLPGRWITIPKDTPHKEWLKQRKAHTELYGNIKELAKKQNHRDPGTPLDKMTPAQIQAWEFGSGTKIIECVTENGFSSRVSIEVKGNVISPISAIWMRKYGYKIIAKITLGKKMHDQTKGMPDNLIYQNEEPFDVTKGRRRVFKKEKS